MTLPNIARGPGAGFKIFPDEETMTAGAAFSRGDVCVVTPPTTDPVSTPMLIARTPASTDPRNSVACVAMEDIASGATGRFLFRGECQAFTQSVAGTTTIFGYSPYTLKTTKTLDADPQLQLPRKIFAFALEPSSGAASATRALRWVQFNGVEGFGFDFGFPGIASNMGVLSQALNTPRIAASAAYASSSTIATFAAVTPGTDDIFAAVPAGFLNAVGRSVLVTASGTWAATGTPTLTLDLWADTLGLTAGTQVILQSVVGTLTALTGQLWTMQWLVTCKTAGATGTLYTSATGAKIANATSNDVGIPVTSAAIDLTAIENLKVRATWSASSASNTTTLDQLLVQRVA